MSSNIQTYTEPTSLPSYPWNHVQTAPRCAHRTNLLCLRLFYIPRQNSQSVTLKVDVCFPKCQCTVEDPPRLPYTILWHYCLTESNFAAEIVVESYPQDGYVVKTPCKQYYTTNFVLPPDMSYKISPPNPNWSVVEEVFEKH